MAVVLVLVAATVGAWVRGRLRRCRCRWPLLCLSARAQGRTSAQNGAQGQQEGMGAKRGTVPHGPRMPACTRGAGAQVAGGVGGGEAGGRGHGSERGRARARGGAVVTRLLAFVDATVGAWVRGRLHRCRCRCPPLCLSHEHRAEQALRMELKGSKRGWAQNVGPWRMGHGCPHARGAGAQVAGGAGDGEAGGRGHGSERGTCTTVGGRVRLGARERTQLCMGQCARRGSM